MTQLTKREQIAFALFLERYKFEENQSVLEMIAHSTNHADKFLKHLTETKPDLMAANKEDISEEKPKESELRPINAAEIAEWSYTVARFNPHYCDQLMNHINALVQYELNKAKKP